jgi:hypothetical protein
VVGGTMVTLAATPTAGDVFFGWSGGGCSGTEYLHHHGDCGGAP